MDDKEQFQNINKNNHNNNNYSKIDINEDTVLQLKEHKNIITYETENDNRKKGNLDKRTSYYFFMKLGKTYTLFGDQYGSPYIVIGPHWYMYLFCCSIITFIFYIFLKHFWNYMNVIFKIIGIIVFLIFFISYTYTFLVNPGIPRYDEDAILGKPREKFRFCQRCGIWEKLKNRKAWKVIHNRCQVFDTKSYDKNLYTINSTTVPYLSENDLRISAETNASLYPHSIAVLSKNGTAIPEGEKFSPISETDATRLQFNDWLLILSGPLPETTREYLCNAVFNPGVIYYAAGGRLIFINRRAAALQNCTELPLNLRKLLRLFPRNKRYSWCNWKTPDKKLFWQRFTKRCRDSWKYRTELLLKMLGRNE